MRSTLASVAPTAAPAAAVEDHPLYAVRDNAVVVLTTHDDDRTECFALAESNRSGR
jgi:hypothetical protein